MVLSRPSTIDNTATPINDAYRELIAEAKACDLPIQDAPAHTGYRYNIPLDRWAPGIQEKAAALRDAADSIAEKHTLKLEYTLFRCDVDLLSVRYVQR